MKITNRVATFYPTIVSASPKWAVALVLFFGLLSPVQSQTQISLDQAIEQGLKKSHTMKIGNQKLIGAQAKVDEANSAMLPKLTVQGGYTRLSNVDPFIINFNGNPVNVAPVILNNYRMQASASQTLFAGNRLSNSKEMAEENAVASELDLTKDKAETILNIQTAYWNLFRAKEFLKMVTESVESAEQHVKDSRSLVANGVATQNDLLRVQLQLTDAQYRKLEAENNVQVGTLALNNLLGLPLTTTVELTSAPQQRDAMVGTLEEMVLAAMKERPEIKATEHRIIAGEKAVSISQGGWYPSIALSANYLFANPNQRVIPARDQFNGTWDAGINFSWDVWNWNTTGHQTDQARAQVEQAKSTFDQLKDMVKLDVLQSITSIQQSQKKIDLSADAVKQATENARVMSQRFKQGTATPTDVNDADLSFLQTKLNATNALVELELAHERLTKALGK